MKRKIRLSLMAALAVAILTTTAAAATGSSNLYDTANDPIVTYSGMQKWAEETFRPSINRTITNTVAPLQTALNEAEQKLSQAQQTIAELEKTIAALAQKVDNINVSAESGGFEVIYVTAGTQVLATSVCSLILRAGTATVVSPFTGTSAQGISDLTTGAELLAGESIPANHYIIIPRGNDGRGIKVTSEGGAYILVQQGGYSLVES